MNETNNMNGNGSLAFRSGFVSLIGRPNVGKSTLMNLFTGEKVSIVSSKPQTTRNKIRSILTRESYQIVFLDTPGIHKPMNKLGKHMQKSAGDAITESDATLFLTEPKRRIPKEDEEILGRLKNFKNPVILVINKIDTVPKPELLKIIGEYDRIYEFHKIVPISALKAENTDELLKVVVGILDEGPMYFPDDIITDQPERRIVEEFIREKALMYLNEEIPHGIAVEVVTMRERENKDLVDVEANLYCEKDSHKPIIIGKNGSMLKRIGTAARREAEALLGSRINLKLWVKVKKDWRESDFLLRSFGYNA